MPSTRARSSNPWAEDWTQPLPEPERRVKARQKKILVNQPPKKG